LLIVVSLRRGYYAADARFTSRLPRMLLALAAMAAVMWGLLVYLLEANYAEKAGLAAAVWGLLALMAAGIISYFAVAHVSGAFRFSDLLGAMRK
jgi:putative peptidoglycan lipid II flippase